jgi:hypothetical protein
MQQSIFIDTDDFKDCVPMMHQNFSWDNDLKQMTIQAAGMYVVPYMSQEEYDSLAANVQANSLTAEQQELLPHAKMAVAYYTYMRLHDTHRVHMSNSGIQESYSSDGTSRPASHYALNDSKAAAADAADHYLDQLLTFMEEKAVASNWFTLWQGSQAYQDIYSMFIWNSKQLSRTTGTKSRKLLHQLRHSIIDVQERDIKPLLGDTLYDSLLSAVSSQSFTDEQTALLARIRSYLGKKALLEAIPLFRVTVGGEGIFFRTYDGPVSRKFENSSDEAVRALVARLERRSDGAWVSLQKFLDNNAEDYPDYTSGTLQYEDGDKVYKRPVWKGQGSRRI